jgi:hypothetical protein
LNVADDVLEVAKEMAYIRQISVGEALSMLARRGMNIPVGTRRDPINGLLVFDVPEDAPELTQEMVERAQELEGLEYAKHFRNRCYGLGTVSLASAGWFAKQRRAVGDAGSEGP